MGWEPVGFSEIEAFPSYLESIPEKRAADGPRYKALGNSMAVPVMRWIGERIQMVENGKGRGDGKDRGLVSGKERKSWVKWT